MAKPGDVARGKTLWADVMKRAALVARLRVHVGVLASQGGEQPHEGSDLSLVEIAAVHEFGSPAAGIPERSFIRSTFAVHAKDALKKQMSALCKAALSGKVDPVRAIDLLGLWAAAAVKRTITSGKVSPKLEESGAGKRTIARKGSSKTLFDTGQLTNSITHEIDQGTK